MSVPVLLNSLNEFGEIDKMRGLSSILSLFPQRSSRGVKFTMCETKFAV